VSSVPVRLREAAVSDRPMPEGERALRRTLGYIERADAPGTPPRLRRQLAPPQRLVPAGWPRAAASHPRRLPGGPCRTYALATLRRRLAAIARVHREARHSLDSRDPVIRNALP
jgi:hypothetical protein